MTGKMPIQISDKISIGGVVFGHPLYFNSSASGFSYQVRMVQETGNDNGNEGSG